MEGIADRATCCDTNTDGWILLLSRGLLYLGRSASALAGAWPAFLLADDVSSPAPAPVERRKWLAVLVVARRVDAEAYSAALNGRELEVCAAASTLEEARRHLQTCKRCEVVLVRLRERSGLPVAHAVRMLSPSRRLVAVGLSDEPRELAAWARAGTLGYVGRDASLDELIKVLLLAGRSEPGASTSLTGVLFRRAIGATDDHQATVGLTQREQQVVELISRGFSNKEIGKALSIQPSTAKNHVHSILTKLQIRHRHDAIQWLDDHTNTALQEPPPTTV